MNEEMHRWAWRQKAGGLKQQLALVILATEADAKRCVKYPLNDLADACRMSPRSLKNVLSALIRAGLIERQGIDAYILRDPQASPPARIPLSVSPKRRAAVFKRDGHHCVRCAATDNLEIDHIHPRARDGGHDDGNLQTLCRDCNATKGDSV